VAELTWITPQGEVWEIKRGMYQFDSGGCSLPDDSWLKTDTAIPAGVSVFLHPASGLDLVDFLAGSEGLAGMAAELGLYLQLVPASAWAALFFFTAPEAALDFTAGVSEWKKKSLAGALLSSLEYYDNASLCLIREKAGQVSALKQLPPINAEFRGAVHAELEGPDSESLEVGLSGLLDSFVRHGGMEEDTWAAADSAGLEKYALLRHGVPELINMEIDRIRQTLPDFYKTAADFMVPPETVRAWSSRYHQDIEESNLRGFVFGHIMEGRLHVNLLAETGEESRRCRELLYTWAAAVAEDGGILAAENGTGRLKRDIVSRYLTAERLSQIRAVLSQLDPRSALGGFGKSGQSL
jgi:FAD/FMN-containing dehydrogenase